MPARIALVVVLAVALAVRLYGLGDQTLTHQESYIPRLVVPDWARTPPARHTLWAVLHDTVLHDNHPPAYYVFMWLWTAVAGTSLFAIRLPSALIGAATVGLLFAVARRHYGAAVALTAAAMLALHGHHVHWSLNARMWVTFTFLGLWSVWLLQGLAERWSLRRALLYTAVSALGLWTEHYYWPFFFAQIVWAAFHEAHRAQAPGILHAQALALTLAAPVPLLLKIQAAIQTNYLEQGEGSFAAIMLDTLGMARLLPPELMASYAGVPGATIAYVLVIAGIVLLLVSFVTPPAVEPSSSDDRRDDRRVWLMLQVAGVAAIVVFMTLTGPMWQFPRRVWIGSALAALTLVVAWIAAATWRAWAPALARLGTWRISRLVALDLLHTQVLVALAALWVLSFGTRVAAHRALLLFAPVLLVLTVRGAFRVARRPAARAAVCVALTLACVTSAYVYRNRPIRSVSDFQALAHTIIPRVQPNDLIVVENEWWAQAIHYYLPPGRFRTIEPRALRTLLSADMACRAPDLARIWVVTFPVIAPDVGRPERRAPATLEGYDVTWRTSARGAAGALFERRRDGC